MSPQLKTSLIRIGSIFGTSVFLLGVLIAMKPTPEKREPEAALPPPLEVSYVNMGAERAHVVAQGVVKPLREINLIAEVGGKVTNVSDQFRDGAYIDAGTQLAGIENRDYLAALTSADARVADAEQLLATEAGRAKQAAKEWRNLGSKEANDLFLRKPQLASAKATLAAAKADRERAQLNVERTKLTAPFEARVRSKNVDIGQYVSPGTKVATLYSTDKYIVRVPLTDRQIALINLPISTSGNDIVNPPVATLSAVYGGQRLEWKGHLARTEASIDERNQLVYGIIEVHDLASTNLDTAVELPVGLFVSVDIEGREIDNVIRVPRTALNDAGLVYVINPESHKMNGVKAEIIQVDGSDIIVRGNNLSASQMVVISAPPWARDGIEIRPRQGEQFIAKQGASDNDAGASTASIETVVADSE